MERKRGLDILKFICCFLVICIHSPFPAPASSIIQPFTRIAVPIFFIITGFFYQKIQSNNKQKQQICKIFRIFLISNITYFFYMLFKSIMQGLSIIEFLHSHFNFEKIRDFLLFNESPFGAHLWYLGALLYVLIIIFFIEKKMDINKLYPIIPILLLLDLIFGKYSVLFFNRIFPYIWVRNFICVGLPYFLVGHLIYGLQIKLKVNTISFLVLVFAFLNLFESFLFNFMNYKTIRDHYFCTTFLAICVFLLALKIDVDEKKISQMICYLGSNLTLGIYILHPIIIDIVGKVVRSIESSITCIYYYISPFVILFISILVSWVLRYVIKSKSEV